MSLATVLPTACLWTARALSVGLSQDLILGIFGRQQLDLDNTKVQFVAGVAIAAIAVLFGHQAAAGAFALHTVISFVPPLFLTPTDARSCQIRTIALILGATLASL